MDELSVLVAVADEGVIAVATRVSQASFLVARLVERWSLRFTCVIGKSYERLPNQMFDSEVVQTFRSARTAGLKACTTTVSRLRRLPSTDFSHALQACQMRRT